VPAARTRAQLQDLSRRAETEVRRILRLLLVASDEFQGLVTSESRRSVGRDVEVDRTCVGANP
jgi:hypothetical protein